MTSTAERRAPDFASRPLGMLIGSGWEEAASGRRLSVEDPATGEVIGTVPEGGEPDVDRAVAAARRSFEAGSWRKLTAVRRERILWRLTDLLEANLMELTRIDVADNGMPISLAKRAVERAIDGLRYYAGMPTKIYGQTSDISGARAEFHAFSTCEPVGVAGLITPWNSPVAVALNKLGPALAAGCSVVLKPAEQTPLSALRIAELALEAGIPEGVVNVVTGFGHVAGDALARHPDVDKISFTGSTEVGRKLIHAAAGNLKRLSLELGGKSPVFVFDDADLDVAIPRAANAIFANSGQVCYAGSRLYVQRGCYEKVVAGIAAFADKIRVGDGFDPKTELGPLISAKQRDAVLSYVAAGRGAGAELVTGGNVLDRPGYFMQPTIFANPEPRSSIMREEIFGPVLAANRFESLDDLPALANDTRYGLGAGVFTRDVSKAHLAAKLIRAGNIWINFYGGADKSLPFGGFKESGWGREGGLDGLEAFLEKKATYIRL